MERGTSQGPIGNEALGGEVALHVQLGRLRQAHSTC